MGYATKGWPRPKQVPQPVWWLVRRPVNAISSSLTIGGMPPRGREILGLPWDDARERRYQRFAAVCRALDPLYRRLPGRMADARDPAARLPAGRSPGMTADPVVEPVETRADFPPNVDAQYVAQLVAHVAASPGAVLASAVAPFTGEPLPGVPQSTPADLVAAAGRARTAQVGWAALPLAERVRPLVRLAELVLKEKDRLVDVVQWETGKSRVHASIELLGLPAVTAHYASNAAGYLAEQRAPSGTPGLVRTRVAHRPKGLVGVIAPWNYPLFLAVGDVIPALLAGNAVLSKADSQAPLSLLAARELAARAGLPDDVWQVVAGRGSVIGPALVDEVDHLAFTGSTPTGRELAAACGRSPDRRLDGAGRQEPDDRAGGRRPRRGS